MNAIKEVLGPARGQYQPTKDNEKKVAVAVEEEPEDQAAEEPAAEPEPAQPEEEAEGSEPEPQVSQEEEEMEEGGGDANGAGVAERANEYKVGKVVYIMKLQ